MSVQEVVDFYLDFIGFRLFSLGSFTFTAGSIVTIIVGLAVALIAGSLTRRLVGSFLGRRSRMPRGVRYTISRAAQILLVSIAILITLNVAGVNLTGLAVVLSLLTVGLGFGLQNLTSNFVSGVILLLERPVQVGDWVVTESVEGEVQAINFRATTIKTLENIFVVVPNSEFMTKNIVNWSNPDPMIRITLPVEVSQNSDLPLVRRLLMSIAQAHSGVLNDPAPEVRHTGFGDGTWQLSLLIWLPTPGNHRRIRSDLYFSIVEVFASNNVSTGAGQREVYLHQSAPREVDGPRADPPRGDV